MPFLIMIQFLDAICNYETQVTFFMRLYTLDKILHPVSDDEAGNYCGYIAVVVSPTTKQL